nr:hypothetical protein [Tanacetum cinerariifolium]
MRTIALLGAVALTAMSTFGMAEEQTLRIGIEAAYPPFASKTADGAITGFDYDIGNALCEKMAVKCVWTEQQFDGLIPSLKTDAGKGFALVGPDFTDSKYFGNGAGIAVRKGDSATAEKLNAAIDAVRADGTYQKIQNKYFSFDIYGG